MPIGLKTSSLVNCPSSMSSYLVGRISWQSLKQAVVVLSSIEYEYIYNTSSTKEAMWLESLTIHRFMISTIQNPYHFIVIINFVLL
jgi:hypothetical protein